MTYFLANPMREALCGAPEANWGRYQIALAWDLSSLSSLVPPGSLSAISYTASECEQALIAEMVAGMAEAPGLPHQL